MTRDTKERVSVEMMKVEASGLHRVRGRTKGGDLYEADLEIKYQLLKLVPPVGKKLRYPDITLTIIHASERGTPKGRERIEWKLITNLVVNTLSEATEKLDWYAMRWKIETFHKILKSGCKAEESKLRTSDRLIKLVSVYCLVSWRIFWMTMINRIEPDAPPEIALGSTAQEKPFRVSHQNRARGRISCPQKRPATWKHRHLARDGSSHRYPNRVCSRRRNLWVIARGADGHRARRSIQVRLAPGESLFAGGRGSQN